MAAVVSTLPARHRPAAAAELPRRRWRQRLPGLALLVSGAAMVPWLTYLSRHAASAHERAALVLAAWVGLDVMEAIGLAATGWLVRRGDPRRCLAAAATAMLLVVDAWFDISTAGSGSRLLNGTLDLHVKLESELAALVHKEAAITFGTGFQANYATLSALTERGDVMICDHNLAMPACKSGRFP